MIKSRKLIVVFDKKYELEKYDKKRLKILIDSNKLFSNSTTNDTKIDDDILYDILDEYKRLKKINNS